MINRNKLGLIGLACTLALVPVLLAAQAQTTKATKITGTTLWAAEDLKWAPMPVPGLDGAQQDTLWGDPTKEAHRILYKWPAGTKAPQHTHTSGERAIVVSGTLTITVEGSAPKKLPAGSYFSMAAGTKHATSVEGDTPCVFYIEREGPFDVIMVEGASAKKKE